VERQENLVIGGNMKNVFVVTLATLVGCGVLAAWTYAQQASQAAAAKAPAREISSLQLQQEIPVPNVMGRLDHMSSDSKRRLLFVSALGNNTAEVIDTFAGRVVHEITGLAEPQGILYVPDFNKIVIANAASGKVNIYDGTSYELRKSLDFSPDPDNLRWDAASKLVVLGYGEDDGGIAFIDPQKEEQVGETLKTGGHPESFQVEQSGVHIFVNCPDAENVVESIDRKTGKVTKWPLKGLRGNFPMQLDEKDHRLFTVTRKPPMLVVLDTETGKEVARLRTSGDSDDLFFDASRKRIYVASGQASISVYDMHDPDHYRLLERVPTTIGARTAYFFTTRDQLYLGIPAKEGQPSQIWAFGPQE
jgi:DNA-binding beta-propeller fold protein YncE